MERVKIDLEFIFRASPKILYSFFTTPSTLIRWFCDEVDIQDDVYTFVWSGSEEVAELIDDIEEERLRFEWEDGEEGEYFEVRFDRSPVTGETILEITDYCDDDEVDDQRQYWNNQIGRLRQETGG
ncbi:MAG: START-like domain-containing protein [Saprospiraceae bacterium]